MIIRSIDKKTDVATVIQTIEKAANKAHCRADFGNHPSARSVRFTLSYDRNRDPSETTRRRSAEGRRTNGVTWQTHKEVLADIFAVHPEVTIAGALATYRGKADFDANHAATADIRRGYNAPRFADL